jgi:hypothetical protein
MRFRSLILTVVLATTSSTQAFVVDHRLSGSWYDPARSGEGWILQMLPDGNALIYWFTFPPAGAEAEQAWIVGQEADFDGNRIVFGSVYTTSGPRFGAGFDPADLVIEPWGELELTFTDCARGTVRYQGPAAYGSGERQIVRLTQLDGLGCEDDAKHLQPAHSAAWFDPAHNGEGWLVERVRGGLAVLYWFSYDGMGRQAWFIGVGHEERDTLVFTDLRRPLGTHFGANFDADAIDRVPWGALHFVIAGCDAGLLRFDAQVPGFGSGLLLPTRLTRLAGTACEPSPQQAGISGTWSLGPPMPVPLSEFAYTTHRERGYIAGGAPGGRDFLEFDPAAGVWRRLPDLPQPRDHAMLAGHADDLYLFGGYVAGQFQPTRQAFRFHLPTSTWHALPDLPMNMGASGAATLNGRIYVADAAGTLVEFDPMQQTYATLPRAPGARDHSQLLAFRGELWLISGRVGSFILRSVDIFDLVTGSWRAGPLLNAGRSGFAAAVVADQIMVAGGEVLGDFSQPTELVPTVEILASEAEGWRFAPLMPTAAHGVAGFGLGGRFHAVGGSTIAGSLQGGVNLNRVYSPQTPPTR